jgi:hypothetical protein
MHPTETLFLLRQLAKFGFALIVDPNDLAVEMIVRNNLAGIVSQEWSTTVGLRTSVWSGDGEKYGLVPTSESAQLVMAEFVVYREETEEDKQWHLEEQEKRCLEFNEKCRLEEDEKWHLEEDEKGCLKEEEKSRLEDEEKILLEREGRWWNRIQFWQRK